MISLLSSPIELGFPSYIELLSAINMRELIVCAARKTSMAFNTDLVDRRIYQDPEFQAWSVRATASGLSSWVRSNLARQLPI